MANKKFIVDFDFRPMLASHYWQSVSVEASNLGLAINRAWAEVKTRPHVKGRRFEEGKITWHLEKKQLCEN